MAWTYYSSSDASAPSLAGTAGSLITVLDAILVAGYGSQPAAGWTKPYTGTNLAAFRSGAAAGDRIYLRVDDTGAQEGRIRCYKTMSDVNTGTEPFPTVAQIAGSGLFVRKSAAASATVRQWACVADDKTCIFLPFPEDFANVSTGGFYAGDIYSFQASDTYRAAIIANAVTGNGTNRLTAWDRASTTISTGNCPGHFIDREHTGIELSHPIYKDISSACVSTDTGTAWSSTSFSGHSFPNESDGGVYMFPYRVATFITASSPSELALRGKLRGLYFCPCGADQFAFGTEITGAGDLVGKTFRLFRSGTSATGNQYAALETTTPASSA